MDTEAWFYRALEAARERVPELPDIVKKWWQEQRYHERQHGIADGYQWCATCQAFKDKSKNDENHPHILMGVDHTETCISCAIFLHMNALLERHLERHATEAGWWNCDLCEGWYPAHGDEDNHATHIVGIFVSECEECKSWPFTLQKFLDVYSYNLTQSNLI